MCGFVSFIRQIKRQLYKHGEYEPIIEDAEIEGIHFIKKNLSKMSVVCVCFCLFRNYGWILIRWID